MMAGSTVSERDERRAYRRVLMDRPVMLETRERMITVRSVDVSAGGIAVRTELELPPGAQVGVYFELPIRYGVEGSAEVLRRDGNLLVIRFTDLPHQAVVAVRSFCRVSQILPAYSGAIASSAGAKAA